MQTGIEPLTSRSNGWGLNHQTTDNSWEGDVQYNGMYNII